MKPPSARVIANANRIAELCARRAWTWSRLCEELGMTQATRSNVRNGRPIRVATLTRIAAKLDVKYNRVLARVVTLREGAGGEAGGRSSDEYETRHDQRGKERRAKSESDAYPTAPSANFSGSVYVNGPGGIPPAAGPLLAAG
jgi:transcriptional regulator with XRE-family HTH domain